MDNLYNDMYVLEESDNIILYYFFFMQTISAFGQVLDTDHNKNISS